MNILLQERKMKLIVLNVYYKAKPGKREEFYRIVNEEGIPEKSRAEEGNVKYEYFKSQSDNDMLLLIEHWKDNEAFDFHASQDYFKRLQQIKSEYVEDVVIDRFEK